jgi:pimeloyl-ACP methyl ester carboxylesterase
MIIPTYFKIMLMSRKNYRTRLASLLICAGPWILSFSYAQDHATDPVAAAYRTTQAWVDRIPWKQEIDAGTITGLIDQNSFVDSGLLYHTLDSISAHGGILRFGPGTFYFKYDLILPPDVLVRGDQPDAIPGDSGIRYSWPTRFVFPRLISPRSRPPQTREPFATQPVTIHLAAGKGEFTGLVDLDIDRAVILTGTWEGTAAAAHRVLLYRIRQNNAALPDPAVPTAFQKANHQGWQLWPDPSIGDLNIAAYGGCLIAGCRLNDQVTDNFYQPDFLTDDGMLFDGSRAEFRFTAHPGILVRGASGQKASPAITIADNIVYTSRGYDGIRCDQPSATLANNRQYILREPANDVADGKRAAATPYNLAYKDSVISEARLFVSEYGDTLPYRLIKPANYDSTRQYPLVVFFHDFWEKGSDNKRQLRQLVWQLLTPENRRAYPCFILAPQLPPTEPKWKTDGLGSETWPIQCSSQLIRDLGAQYAIDTNRVYAIGNSMGGAGALNLAVQHPDQIAAVLGISVFYRLTKNSVLQVNHIPIWFIYGARDERIDPVIRQTIRTDMREGQAIFRYTEIPAMGHRCWNEAFADVPSVLPWLFEQHK